MGPGEEIGGILVGETLAEMVTDEVADDVLTTVPG
jgi:hypothetical protein